MERNFYNEDFEQFLKQKADQYKMYSSDRVWDNIYSSLHNRRKWFSLGLLLLLLTTALLVTRQALLNNYNKVANKVNQNAAAMAAKQVYPNTNNNVTILHNEGVPYATPFRRGATKRLSTLSSGTNKSQKEQASATTDAAFPVNDPEAGLIFENNTIPHKADAVNTSDDVNNDEQESTSPVNKKETPKQQKPKPDIQNDEAALNILPPVKSKWSIQLYASPIVSYRRLSNTNNSTKYVPVAANYGGESIDNYVHHKPAVGFEMGTKLQYAVTNSLSFYAGVQLNYSRYYIDAYNYQPEKATIALGTNSINPPDTLTNFTSIRNFEGYSPEQLQNQYFQVSMPIGGELKVLGGKRLQFSVAGSIQPTYLISSSSYLISSDFKNYIQSSDLTRRFNIHTNFEAFISYKTSTGLKWQLGPQFRYQVLSSYSDQYPVREYLMEYGIKLGISKTIK